jgi:hypothetical protein
MSCTHIWGFILEGQPSRCYHHCPYFLRRRVALGGSFPDRQIVARDRFSGHYRLKADYFCENPIFGNDLFHTRFIFIHHLFCNTNIDGIHCTHFCFKFVGSECQKQCSLHQSRDCNKEPVFSVKS